MKNYLDDVAAQIATRCRDLWLTASDEDRALYRIYAVLALTTGEQTTNENVHDAWAAWRAATKPAHRSLVPFDQLTREVQELDAPYRDAIRAVASERTRRVAPA